MKADERLTKLDIRWHHWQSDPETQHALRIVFDSIDEHKMLKAAVLRFDVYFSYANLILANGESVRLPFGTPITSLGWSTMDAPREPPRADRRIAMPASAFAGGGR